MAAQSTPNGVSRRQFLTTTAAGLGAVVAWQVLGTGRADAAGTASGGPASVPIDFTTNWLFGASVDGGTDPGFDDSGLDTVTLPHTVVPLSWRNWEPSSWEQVWLYRKHFDAPAGVDGGRVFLDVAGAMTGASLTLNGQALPGHVGGYTPFSVELTDVLQPRANTLAVVLDSRFSIDVPPDHPTGAASSSVDFWQPGGIYRDVTLRVVPQVFLADVFAKPVNVLDAANRAVVVQFTLDAALVPRGAVRVRVDLRDATGDSRTIASASVPVTITDTGQLTGTATLTGLDAITLWDTDNPRLYEVITTLTVDGDAVHDYRTRIGFREATFTVDGFFLNGNRVKLFGVNRHQFYPFAGGALPERVQRKDAEILRNELNCVFVRCSHYPQAAAFYDACDELGLMVWEEMPGWGFFGDADWQAAAQQNLIDMITRDRNHPSIIVWGAMPNESGPNAAQFTAWNALAHSLDDSRPTGGDDDKFSAADEAAFPFDVYSHHDYSHQTGPDGLQEPNLAAPTDPAGKPYLVCEAVGALSGPATFYRRIDAQSVQQGQATAHARVHDIAYADDRYCGVAAWSGFEYESGNGNVFGSVKYTGVVDVFRVPKPGASIYQAQVDPKTRPVIAPAFYWDFGPTSPINALGSAMICSNLDRLEVFVGGAHFATATPDVTDYGSLPYPPSFVDFSSVSAGGNPELRIDGYLGNKLVASRRFSSDTSGDRLTLALDDTELTADGSDATRAVFRAVDRYGQPRPYPVGEVSLSVHGPAALVGDNPFAFADAGGVGAVWLRSLRDSPGTVTLTATHPTLGAARASLRVRQDNPGGPPAPYGTLAAAASAQLAAPGETTTISATFTNVGNANLTAVSLSVEVPADWSVTPIGATTFSGVTSGRQVSASWQIGVPADAPSATVTASIAATYSAHNERARTSTSVSLLVPYASLAAAFNHTAISDDSDVDTADIDGVGNSYSEQALTAAGLAPGASIVHDGITFTWPDVAAGQPDNVLAEGQTVLVSGSGATLGFLGGSSPSDLGGAGTVHYTDGTTSAFTLLLDNYFNPPDTTNNDVIATMPYLNSQGIGGRVRGQRQQTVYVYYNGVPITAGKTVRAVTLPTGGSAPAGGRINGAHLFAIGLG